MGERYELSLQGLGAARSSGRDRIRCSYTSLKICDLVATISVFFWVFNVYF